MKHKTSFSLVFISRIVIALAILFIAQPAVGAQSPESAGNVETRDFFSAAASVPGARFVHTATAANINGHYTYVDHPLTNDNPNAIVLVTQNWNPGGVGGTYNDHPIGVWYSSSAKKWAVFNQDFAAMPTGTAFNVLIPATGADVFVHTATAANIDDNYTVIDHPLTNENPNAIVFVTQNYNPGGLGGKYNDQPIGVLYSSAVQKWAVFNQDDTTNMPVDAAFNVLIPVTGADVFVHTATAANTSAHVTYIDHPLTNDNPNAIVFVTQNWNPGGGVIGVYNNRVIGVYYASGAQKWAVFNQDTAADMPVDVAFNVLIPATGADVFVHTATATSISDNYTYIDHPLTNDNTNAIVFVTQTYNPGGVGGEYNDQPIGVWYSSGAQKWAVFNQDHTTDMPVDAAFNVLIPTVDTSVFVHIARAANIDDNVTYIDHPLTNDNPNAIVFVTQNWNPSGVLPGNYNDQPIGVWYSSAKQKWAVFNQDYTTDMPVDAAFNVLIPATGTNVFVHTATAANIDDNVTYIDHPLTNKYPNAIVLVTQNYNPGGVGGEYNDQAIGVWYSSAAQKWAVFNQDTTADMPVDAAFNVIVFVKIYLPIILR